MTDEEKQKYQSQLDNINDRIKGHDDYANKLSEENFKQHITFYRWLAFITSTAISLSITGVVQLYSENAPLLDQYKFLLIGGWVFLFLSSISSGAYMVFISRTSFNLMLIDRSALDMKREKLLLEILRKGGQENTNDLSKVSLLEKANALAQSRYNLNKVIALVVIPTTSLLGLLLGFTLVGAYFSAQLFNF